MTIIWRSYVRVYGSPERFAHLQTRASQMVPLVKVKKREILKQIGEEWSAMSKEKKKTISLRRLMTNSKRNDMK